MRKAIKKIKNKTLNKLYINLYFIGTYTFGVTMLYPFIEQIIKNKELQSISQEQIIFFIIFSITQFLNIFDYNKFNIKYLTQKEKILNIIFKTFKKIIDAFTDLLAYVTFSVPILMFTIEKIYNDDINVESIIRKIIIMLCGSIIFIIKSIIETKFLDSESV